MTFELIYCAGGNPRCAQIAVDAGWLYGVQCPASPYHPLDFVDQDWKKPDRATYMHFLSIHRPRLATVLDMERTEQREEVLSWATEAAQYVETVIVIPKYFGAVADIPHAINGAHIRLGYSVPTKFGGTEVPVWEFGDRPVHLLGGQPQTQMHLSRYLNVVSADTNYHQKMALKYNQFWANSVTYARNRYWPTLREAGDERHIDAPYEAFQRSCANIRAAWDEFWRNRGSEDNRRSA